MLARPSGPTPARGQLRSALCSVLGFHPAPARLLRGHPHHHQAFTRRPPGLLWAVTVSDIPGSFERSRLGAGTMPPVGTSGCLFLKVRLSQRLEGEEHRGQALLSPRPARDPDTTRLPAVSAAVPHLAHIVFASFLPDEVLFSLPFHTVLPGRILVMHG